MTTGLGVCRCLGSENIPVVWFDSSSKQIGFYSKYCIGKKCPNPRDSEKEYVNMLLGIGEKLVNKAILFPIGDIEVFSILKNKKRLEKYFLFPMADFDVTDNFLNKRLFYNLLEKLNIDYPRTFFPRKLSDIKDIEKKVSYPCLLKPSYSASFVVDFKTKMFFIKNSTQLKNSFKKAKSKYHDVMIQEIIPGSSNHLYGFNGYFDKKLKLNGCFTSRRIREWPTKAGCACFVEELDVPELAEIVYKLIKKINYFGIIDSDFKKDPRDGRFKLLDINPRFWMQISLPARCGINLPYISYMETLGKSAKKVHSSKKNIKWIFMVDDIRSAHSSISNGDLSITDWLFSLMGKKEFAIFNINDPLPFFSIILNLKFNKR
jgi:predicted ATP-grasp superfamily ATP-dependent carboligase